MNPTLIASIVQAVVALAKDVPGILTVIEDAIAKSKSGTGPTTSDIAAAVAQAQAENAAIQAS